MSNSARRKIVEMHKRIEELERKLAAQTAPVVPNLADVAERIAGLIFAQTTCTMDVRKFEQVASSIIMRELSATPSAPSEDKQDAARYRFLRDRPIKDAELVAHGVHFTFAVAEPKPNQWRVHSKRTEEMDAAIDAAIAATAQQKEGE